MAPGRRTPIRRRTPVDRRRCVADEEHMPLGPHERLEQSDGLAAPGERRRHDNGGVAAVRRDAKLVPLDAAVAAEDDLVAVIEIALAAEQRRLDRDEVPVETVYFWTRIRR